MAAHCQPNRWTGTRLIGVTGLRLGDGLCPAPVMLYVDVGRASQVRRLAHRQLDPLGHWKSSHVNETAVEYWKAYTDARNAMLLRTHATLAPWQIVQGATRGWPG